ncbi:MAG: glucuronate isomerase [Candidatus Marinimicrobia bacterium]|nr:glucuronate isomerase [Candidatus Neomarinimicrobiota bacterium]
MVKLNPHRFFDPDTTVRRIAAELYDTVKDMPIISPHGHVDPKLFADNRPFPNPAQLFIIPDHYVFRMLYSQGIPPAILGVPTVDGSATETDPRKIWQVLADHWYLFAGTPSGIWLSHELYEVFQVSCELNSDNAQKIYDELQEKLNSSEYLPRALFDSFNIEVLSTTDAAEDDLQAHQEIRKSGWQGNVVPSFRPDSVTDIARPDWLMSIQKLSLIIGKEITRYSDLVDALKYRRKYFIENGAKATDQGVLSPYAHLLSEDAAETIFQRALNREQTSADEEAFIAHMLMKMAEMSVEDGLVMQIHPGVLRNHNRIIFNKHGLDKGCDIPIQTEYTKNMQEFLNRFGNELNLTVILFTLDETVYSRELAPLAGHYPALKLGPAWWFNDSIEGMTRFRETITETAGFYNTVGFNDDTRAFPSIPARHDVARRVDANFLAGKVARHIISKSDAETIIRALTYDLVKKAYKF